jgi:battenin
MLSAAHDILGSSENKNGTQSSLTTERTNPLLDDPANKTNKYDCNNLSTGAILIADVLPGIVAKFMAPFFMHKIKYSHRVLFVVLANLASFLLVALVPPRFEALIFLGVGFASIASSFGEITFLSMTTLYDRSLSITGWASGTGGAGLVGSFGYAALTWSGLSPQSTILAMLFIPVLMAVSYAFLPSIEFASARNYSDLGQDGTTSQYTRVATEDDDDETPASSYEHLPPLPESGSVNSDFRAVVKDNAVEFLRILCPLLKYMIPLFFVYFAQYFINQGLFELLYFRNDSIIKDHKSQYRFFASCLNFNENNLLRLNSLFLFLKDGTMCATKRLCSYPGRQFVCSGYRFYPCFLYFKY